MAVIYTKTSGSSWTGTKVGHYKTDLTSNGLAIESGFEQGSVQIYPLRALRILTPEETEEYLELQAKVESFNKRVRLNMIKRG